MYLTYYVYLVGTKEVTNCKNARSGKLQDNRVLGGTFEPKRDMCRRTETTA
jgi:hypothetical protein